MAKTRDAGLHGRQAPFQTVRIIDIRLLRHSLFGHLYSTVELLPLLIIRSGTKHIFARMSHMIDVISLVYSNLCVSVIISKVRK